MADSASTGLTELVSCETLHRLQDSFAALGKVTVCVSTTEGELITCPTWGSRFSELIGSSNAGRVAFADCVRACVANPTTGVPSICHDGMTFYATRILFEERQLGMIVVGTRAPEVPPQHELLALATRYDIDLDELSSGTSQIDPYMGGTPEDIHRFADVLADTIAALYAQAFRIQGQLSDLHTVHELTGMLAGSRDLQEILDRTVERVVEVMGVKACGIRLLNEETGELVVKAVCNLSDEYLQKGPVLIAQNVIDGAAFAGETVYIENAPTDQRIRYPENARREGIVSGLCVPMTYRGQTVGVLRVYTDRLHHFSADEESLLRSIGSQAASAVITSRLFCEQDEAARVQRQLEAAGEIQRRMLPASVPDHLRLSVGCVFDPTLDLGGDFYDFIELSGGRWGMGIADVVGKGLPAALMMASVRSALRGYARQAEEVAEVVSLVNRHMCRDTLVGEFATLVYGVFSDDGMRLSYCCAGHEPLLLLRGEGCLDLSAGGLVIGLDPKEVFESEEVALQEGDVLVFVTDGVCEALDFEDRCYSRSRLLDSVRRHRSLDAQQLAQQILWDVRRFVGLADQSDDITVVVVKVG